MVSVNQIVIGLLVLQIYVSAAPSNTTTHEDAAKAENEEPKLDSLSLPIDNSENDSDSTMSVRQKRFHNFYGYGFPPISPVQYTGYVKRDQASDLGEYGIDDPLSQIHRRLQEIASVARQPPPPPPVPAHIPLFFPIIFIPQYGCACNPDVTTQPEPPQSTPQPPPQPYTPTTTAQPLPSPLPAATTQPLPSTELPDVVNRLPEMDDDFANETVYDDEEDFSRPISFDPIFANSSLSRPAPLVEHGSSQGNSQGMAAITVKPNMPTQSSAPSGPSNDPPPVVVASGPYPPSLESARESPSVCDGAILSCCHQLHVTYDCFAAAGCSDTTFDGNPCDPLVILKAIDKFQKFYSPTRE